MISQELKDEFYDLLEYNLQNDPEMKEVYLIQNIEDQIYGLIYISDYSEYLDNHCEQCMEEIFILRMWLNEEKNIKYYCADIGPTKIENIKQNKNKMFSEAFVLVEQII